MADAEKEEEEGEEDHEEEEDQEGEVVPKAAAYDAATETAKIRARELSKLRWAHPPAH